MKKTIGAATRCIAAVLLLAAAGCRKAATTLQPSVTYSQIDPATAGAIEGTIHFAKRAPQRIEIDMAQDPACAMSTQTPNYSEEYVVNDGKMANIFVYVKDGLGNRVYAIPGAPAVLDQRGCRYMPHVIGVMAGQPVEFRTSDPTMHNVHATPAVQGDQAFDVSQPPNGAPVRHAFARPETMIPVRCNNHPWMEAFINVAPNPFFAVSDERGHFIINGLPPGLYTLEAVQEKLGPQTQTVTVATHQTSQADFTYGK